MKKKQNVFKRKRDFRFLKVIPTCLFSALLVSFFALVGYSVAKPFGNVGEAKKENSSELVLDIPEPSAAKENIAEMKAYRLSESEINDIETLERMLDRIGKGYDTAVIPLKIKGGRLNYNSYTDGAESAGADSDYYPELSDIVDTVKSYGFKPAASFNTLNDNLYPVAENSAGFVYKKGGKLWYDGSAKGGGKAWLAPTASAGSYLSSLLGEISAAGFEYIIATDVEYPEFSRLGLDAIGEKVTNENRYLDLIDIVNSIAPAVSDGCGMWIEIPAADMFEGKCEVFQPMLLDTDKTVLEINLDDFKSTVKCGGENVDFSKMTVAEKVEKICEIAGTYIYKTSFIPEITGSTVSVMDKNKAAEALEKLGYKSYIVR